MTMRYDCPAAGVQFVVLGLAATRSADSMSRTLACVPESLSCIFDPASTAYPGKGDSPNFDPGRPVFLKTVFGLRQYSPCILIKLISAVDSKVNTNCSSLQYLKTLEPPHA